MAVKLHDMKKLTLNSVLTKKMKREEKCFNTCNNMGGKTTAILSVI